MTSHAAEQKEVSDHYKSYRGFWAGEVVEVFKADVV